MWPQLTPLGSRCTVSMHLGKRTWFREPSREQESLPRWVTFGMSSCNPTGCSSVAPATPGAHGGAHLISGGGDCKHLPCLLHRLCGLLDGLQ